LDLELGGEFSEATAVAITSVSGLEGRLQTFRRRLDVSRQVFKNDDVNLLKRIATELGFAASRVESNLATMLLESNPTMGDGLPMFGDSNIIAAALSGTSFDAALKLLRLQLTPAGNVANNRAAVLAVSAGLELTARSFLHLAGFDEVRVVVLPALPDGRWYVLASPLLSPAIGRLALSGPHAATTAPITIGPARTPAAFDGLSFKAISDLGTVALNRVGCVKGGA
jgi:hypothetical protein